MPVLSKTAIKGIDITTYFVKDPVRAIAFYRDIMEMTPTWTSEQGAEFTLSDGSTFGLWRPDDGKWVAGAGVMFAVEDAKAAVDHYRKRGAKIVEHVEDTPVCHMAFGEDSEGNHFIIHQRKTQD